MSEIDKLKQCTTHHNACDCREYQLRTALKEAKDALEFYSGGWIEERGEIEMEGKTLSTINWRPLFSRRNDHGNKARTFLDNHKDILEGL